MHRRPSSSCLVGLVADHIALFVSVVDEEAREHDADHKGSALHGTVLVVVVKVEVAAAVMLITRIPGAQAQQLRLPWKRPHQRVQGPMV